MRRTSRPTVRWFAAGLTAAATACPALPAFSAEPALPGSAFSYSTPTGESFFAVAVRAADLAGAYRPADRHVVLVDTSASQSGEYQARAMSAVDALLASLPAQATVSVYAVDVSADAMTDGFLPAGEAREAVLSKLEQRVPLGATDLSQGLTTALAAFGSQPAGSIVYIGDGMSASNLLQTGELKSLAGSLRSRKVPVHAFAVGPDTDWRLLGVLAHQTGGYIALDQRDADAPAAIGRTLAGAVSAPVLYPESLSTDGADARLVGGMLPPLRADRETILLGRGDVPSEVRLTAAGHETVLPIDGAKAVNGLPVVRTLALSAEATDGLNMPAAGKDLLAASDAVVGRTIDGLASAAAVAKQANRIDEAKQFLVSLETADPAGSETEQLRLALAQAETAAEGDVIPPPPAAEVQTDDLIEAEIARQRIRTQQITLETNDLIDQARQIRATNAADALNILRRQENSIRLATDIDAESRRQLLRRLNNEIVISENVREKNELNMVLRQERLAQIEAEQRMIDRMVLEEEQLHQLIERVRALMDAGYHGDDAAFEEARIVANDAINLRPGNGPATAALFTATAADQLNKTFRLKSLREDRFLETLYQVELSHVPFPDEPPIVYPAPEVWQALTQRRQKYNSVSLESSAPAEEAIRRALEEPTELVFPNSPLRTALEYLADVHEINIVIDDTALAEDNINVDDPIDINLTGISLKSGLKILLEPLGMTYVIEDEVMKITTILAADETTSIRVYPVGDLVIPIISGGGMGGGMGGMGGGMGGMGGGMGGMGGGMGGMGGGMGGMGGGMGGGGFFSVPAPQLPQPQAAPRAERQRREVPQAPAEHQPLDDAEVQQLLDDAIGEQASHTALNGQAFASVRDDAAEAAGKKK